MNCEKTFMHKWSDRTITTGPRNVCISGVGRVGGTEAARGIAIKLSGRRASARPNTHSWRRTHATHVPTRCVCVCLKQWRSGGMFLHVEGGDRVSRVGVEGWTHVAECVTHYHTRAAPSEPQIRLNTQPCVSTCRK
jgi:hypothetical protein